MAEYLDSTGLTTLWSKIKSYITDNIINVTSGNGVVGMLADSVHATLDIGDTIAIASFNCKWFYENNVVIYFKVKYSNETSYTELQYNSYANSFECSSSTSKVDTSITVNTLGLTVMSVSLTEDLATKYSSNNLTISDVSIKLNSI